LSEKYSEMMMPSKRSPVRVWSDPMYSWTVHPNHLHRHA